MGDLGRTTTVKGRARIPWSVAEVIDAGKVFKRGYQTVNRGGLMRFCPRSESHLENRCGAEAGWTHCSNRPSHPQERRTVELRRGGEKRASPCAFMSVNCLELGIKTKVNYLCRFPPSST